MKMLIPACLSLVALGALATAQQPITEPAPAPAPAPSAAEHLFRDAWWAESGKNDLETALRGYLAAAAADGPASVRAKALLHAGGAQQRLGKAEAALELYRKIVGEYATERSSVEQARVHLREMTAVDLRKNYDEWYERRLFGEEIQLLILGKLEALTNLLSRRPTESKEQADLQTQVHGLKAEILAFGKGAVPALQKTCIGGHDESREHAIEMLFTLCVVPPIAALLTNQGWLGDDDHWTALLAAPSPISVPASPAWHRPLLAAAHRGPTDLLRKMIETRDPNLLDNSHIVTAITMTLLQQPNSVAATLAAMQSPETPLRLRPAMEQALIESDGQQPRLSAQQWLDVSAEPLQFELRVRGIGAAAGLLDYGDESVLETILLRTEATADKDRGSFVEALANGLQRLVAPQNVPWTSARMRRLMLLAQWTNDGNIAETTRSWCLHRPTRDMLAEAILGEPVAFLAALKAMPVERHWETMITDQLTISYGDERDTTRVCTMWHAAMLGVLERNWTKWDEGNRAAAVFVVQQGLRPDGSPDAIVRFLTDKRPGDAAAVQAAIEALLVKLAG